MQKQCYNSILLGVYKIFNEKDLNTMKITKIIMDIVKNIGVAILALVILFFPIILAGIIESLFSNIYLGVIVSTLVRIAITVSLSWVLSTKLLKIDTEELGLKVKKVDIGIIVAVIALPVLILIFYAFILPGQPYVAKEGMFWGTLISAVFGIGIADGFCEELVFRGIIFRYMKKTLGVWAAVIIPAILFSLAHIKNMETFNVTDLVILTLAGSSVAIMFSLIALKTGSIYPGAFAHALWNILIIGGLFGIGDIVNGAKNDSYIIIPIESSNKLLTGGNFGVEAAIPAIIGYIAVAVFVFFRKNKES